MAVESDEVSIRSATTADAAAIARVHIASWRGAYVGIVPDEYLASLDVDQREQSWVEDVIASASDVWIAEANGRALGFACIGPCRDEDAEPGYLEIYAIYLDPEAWGRGVARELMRTMMAKISENAVITLWVIADNARALHFYRRNGFVTDGVERREDYGGRDVTLVRFRRG